MQRGGQQARGPDAALRRLLSAAEAAARGREGRGNSRLQAAADALWDAMREHQARHAGCGVAGATAAELASVLFRSCDAPAVLASLAVAECMMLSAEPGGFEEVRSSYARPLRCCTLGPSSAGAATVRRSGTAALQNQRQGAAGAERRRAGNPILPPTRAPGRAQLSATVLREAPALLRRVDEHQGPDADHATAILCTLTTLSCSLPAPRAVTAAPAGAAVTLNSPVRPGSGWELLAAPGALEAIIRAASRVGACDDVRTPGGPFSLLQTVVL